MAALNQYTPHLRQWWLLLAVANLLVFNVLCSPNDITPYTSTPFSAASSSSLFGIRGGAGFFGFGRSSKSQGNGGGGDDNPKRYPPLSQDEIEEKLNIPVFGLTDTEGNGVILSAEDGSNIFHLFFSKHMADAALKAVTDANAGAPELKVCAFHLGKCWFKLINSSETKKYRLQKYGKDAKKGDEVTKPIQFRLVPNMKDLMGARILTGLKPGDVESLKEAVEEPNPPKALSIIQNAVNSETTKFNSPFNEIPVFAIAQMRVRQKDDQGNATGKAMLPMHLSTKTMSDTWNQFVHTSPQFEDAEATLQLIELHKMVEMMQNESDFDFRNVVFIMPSYDKDQNNDLDEDSDDDSDDDDGGGGDNGMKADYDQLEPEPFISMEIFADTQGPA
eukprot:CAMPEP_0183727230 /NCGR_PEP_ID=MMETSP0737-20130205/25174_1 /TAXON_ID=385413 /ORGANISM="Thalassiosira miniscula, Strain CCMP1093" /LENGTH=389 /DNA_ID=CAMNT_0025958813 /DNA_START=37 /DNA_END=1203 /DNA_ORIENTATION=+